MMKRRRYWMIKRRISHGLLSPPLHSLLFPSLSLFITPPSFPLFISLFSFYTSSHYPTTLPPVFLSNPFSNQATPHGVATPSLGNAE
jgi:hypothetical protein